MIAEQKVQHKNAELLAVQGKIDKLQSRFNTETERLRRDQIVTLESECLALERHIDEKKRSGILLEDNVASLIIQRESLKKQISDGQTLSEATDITVTESKNIIKELEIVATNVKEDIESLNNDKVSIESKISKLATEEINLKSSISVLQEAFKGWKQQADDAESVYSSNIVEKDKIIATLDAKILNRTQELEKIQQEGMTLRNDLAIWQKTLEERDQNLRIREAKVEQGEGKIVQNANLMNL